MAFVFLVLCTLGLNLSVCVEIGDFVLCASPLLSSPYLSGQTNKKNLWQPLVPFVT